MASNEYNKVTNVEVQNETNPSTSGVIPTINQNPSTSTIAKVYEEIVVSSDLFAYDPAKYSFCKEKSIVNILKVGELGTLEFLSEIRNGVYSIAICPKRANFDYQKLVNQLDLVIPEATQWKNRRPNIGDLVFGKTLNRDWVRGYVVSILPNLRMAMIDEAKLVLVSNLATCEKPISDMCAFSGICELINVAHKFREGEHFQFKVTGRADNEKPDEFEISIRTGHFEFRATVKPWIPMPEQLGMPCADVTNGSMVCVTGYRNHIHMYVRPLDNLGLARYNFIIKTIAKWAEISPFWNAPSIGKWALALSADGYYYRAYITKVEEDTVQVMFHDLGRREYVDRKKLKMFPEHLQKLGYCISKIRLQGIPKDIPPLIPIIRILDNLVENKVPLILTYDGLPDTEGVYLKYLDGGSVNDVICNCLEPYRVKAPE